jgi:sulfur relay (sulfurtransferase) complex TusBCD TusD component (DsrE family)
VPVVWPEPGHLGDRLQLKELAMPGYLLIESRDPFESTGAARTCELALELRAAGHEVALFLVQNGVLTARKGVRRAELDKVIRTQIEVLADDFSLRERGISSASLIGGVRAAPIDSVVERMAAGWNALWH